MLDGARAAAANTRALRLLNQYQETPRTDLLDDAVRRLDRACG